MKIKKKFALKIALGVILVLVGIIVLLGITRSLTYKQIDDVHPSINCSEKYIKESDVLMIIPLFNNDSIANHPEWCKKILEYNKTLGLHGVRHTYNEFLSNISKEDMDLAIGEFKKCFEKYPELFEPPQWEISSENRKLVETYIPVTNQLRGMFHKIYHCEESGNFGYRFLGIRITNSRISKS